jgi:hypothetical protein
MAADPKWLEILKASGWQTAALAIAFGVLFSLIHANLLPSPGASWLVAIAGACIVCLCLSFASILSALAKAIPAKRWFSQWSRRRKVRKSVEDYIPFMTDNDKRIIGYLLNRNQKTFTAALDGGYATTLIARGIVAASPRPGQIFPHDDLPFSIPDEVWQVLCEHRSSFPAPPPGYNQHPWRVHWMAR